jgi:hypothetical protein
MQRDRALSFIAQRRSGYYAPEMVIRRKELLKSLQRVAQLRSLITLGLFVIYIGVICVVLPASVLQSPWLLPLLFGPPLVLSTILGVTMCKAMVKCPHCSQSLWKCGSGNFKPRRMRIRDGVDSCPHCDARFV